MSAAVGGAGRVEGLDEAGPGTEVDTLLEAEPHEPQTPGAMAQIEMGVGLDDLALALGGPQLETQRDVEPAVLAAVEEQPAFGGVEGAGPQADLEAADVGRCPGDDVDHAANRVGAEQRRARSADDLDTGDRLYWQAAPELADVAARPLVIGRPLIRNST